MSIASWVANGAVSCCAVVVERLGSVSPKRRRVRRNGCIWWRMMGLKKLEGGKGWNCGKFLMLRPVVQKICMIQSRREYY